MANRTAIAIIVIALIALGGYFLVSSKATAPTPEAVNEGNPAAPSAEQVEGETIVTYTDGGFSPAEISVREGDTVRFVNNSATGMWVGADVHPTHTSYDGTSTNEHCVDGVATGGSFDQCKQATPGESWEFTFTKEGTFNYHNHARAAHGGSVEVAN